MVWAASVAGSRANGTRHRTKAMDKVFTSVEEAHDGRLNYTLPSPARTVADIDIP